ncbi:MAG: pyruvate kinase [Bacteroidota bacterium]
MKIKKSSILSLIKRIEQIQDDIEKEELECQQRLAKVDPIYKRSAKNLIHYNALRKHDIREVQKKLKNLGMSRLANSSSHVLASLLSNKLILHSLLGQKYKEQKKAGLSIKNGKKLQNYYAKELLGYRSKGRRVRIMVTQPTESAFNYPMVLNMVKNGMNCARINCAHDNPEIWLKIINNLKAASKQQGRKVKITMDLAGPKIRTGDIVPGPKVLKISPEMDEKGNIIQPAVISFVDVVSEESEPHLIPVDPQWMRKLRINDKLLLKDTRSKERTLKVVGINDDVVHVHVYDTTYIETGTLISVSRAEVESTTVGDIPSIEQSILLRPNDLLKVTKFGLGQPTEFDEDGNVLKQAKISCQSPEVFDRIKPGEKVLFDDGKIEGIILECFEDHFQVRIKKTKEQGSRLKAEKGMNFPTSDLQISGLTEKDRKDLSFVVKHADAVNFSFVNSKEDVLELYEELFLLGALDKISIIYKIETRKAYDNLVDILLTAMQSKHIGVMIARGDLAVETGWNNIGWVQKEILGICDAAHVPVIWATQVFETLAKKGIPSRAEITDATTSLKADCVMLNKGTYIIDAIALLNTILGNMESREEKNESMLPQMEKFT